MLGTDPAFDASHLFRAFLPLFPRPSHDQPVESGGGWHSRLDTKLSGIWLTSPDKYANLESFLEAATSRADRRLDILSVVGAAHHTIAFRNRDVVAMRQEHGRQDILIRSPHIRSIPYSMRSHVANDANASEPRTPLASYNESMRYFRLAQVSTDPFGCFIYLYRALESTMDELGLGTGGREKEWFSSATEAALAQCRPATLEALGPLGDPVSFVEYVYEDIRNGIFHAKTKSKNPLRPLYAPDAARVRVASRAVMLVFIDLVRDFLPIGQGESIATDLDLYEASSVPPGIRGMRLVLDGGGRHDRIISHEVKRDETHLGHLLDGDPLVEDEIPKAGIHGVDVLAENGKAFTVRFNRPIHGCFVNSLRVQLFMAVDFELAHRTNGWIPEEGVQVAPGPGSAH